MSRIRVRLKPNKGIKVRTQTTYLYDPTIIDAEVQQAKDWATKTDGLVEEEGAGIDYSAKAYAIGGTGTEANNAKYYAEQAGLSETNASNSATSASGSASSASSSASLSKDWATKTDGTVDGVDYSSKYYAQQITPIATDITTVAGIASDVTTVSNNSTNITTVSGNTTNINKVASDINSVNLVADDIDIVHTVAVDISTVIDVANNKTNIDAVAGNATNINAVAGNETNINSVAGNATNINTVNANKTNIDTVAGISSDVTAVASNESNINAVADNETNINSVNENKTNIDAVAGDLTNIDAVANDLTNIDNASTYANNANTWAEGTDSQVSDLGGEKSAKGWADRAKEIAEGIGSIYKPAGSIAFESLPTLSSDIQGNVYNITNDFTTTYDFVEGAGKYYPAGTNVVCIDTGIGVYKWDVLSGIVDLSGYVPTSRTVNGKALSSDISLTYSDVGALPDSTVIPTVNDATLTIQKNGTSVATFTANSSTNATANIIVPTKTSDITNDSGFITSSALNGYATEAWVGQQGFLTSTALTGYATQQWVGQQGYITDITSAMVTTALGYSPVNPTSLASVATSGSYNDLSDKPTIPSAQVNSDWNANSGVAQILNKPTLATVATSGAYSDLSGKPTIPTVNNPTITLTQGGTTKGSFTLNQSSGATIDLDAGGGSPLPIQTGNSGKFLTTDGTNASWATVDALPDQTGNNGKALLTDGKNAYWGDTSGVIIRDWSV